MINQLHSSPPSSIAGLIQQLLTDSGYRQSLRTSSDPQDEERLANLEELVTAARQYDDLLGEEASLEGFLEETSLVSDVDNWDPQSPMVTLMTLHAAKGLEFPVVSVIALEQNILPHELSADNPSQLEEERRLFYVGLTRAMEKIYLMYANHRRRLGSDELYGMVSRFVTEVPENILEKISFTSALTRKVIGGKPGKHTKTAVSRTVVLFDDFTVGDYVEHSIFGIGKVQALSGQGENQRVGIQFKDGLKKKLVVKFANLKKVDSLKTQ